jgi:uncharacterized protein YsxB (DUF464 family)
MTEIIYNRKCHILSLKGHAGYAERGKDIVCAGISALTLNLSNILDKMAAEEMVEVSQLAGDGRLYIQVIPQWQYEEEVTKIFDYTINGLKLIAGQYPEYVRIKKDS